MNAATPPEHILGYTIRSRTRIYVTYILPTCLALLVYINQTASDLALGYQHLSQHELGFGVGTLILVFIPPVLTFILVISSQEQRTSAHAGRSKCTALALGLLRLMLFPFFVVYRFTLRLFWSIEALYHNDDDMERMKCLAKATQTSNIELYLLIQAYAQAAPQIILQLYHMLSQDLFRNYETSSVQALCLVFSALDLAGVTTSYHRIESQRRVGRHYPWATEQQVKAHCCQLEQHERLCSEAALKKRESERTIASFPASDKIMANFHARQQMETDPSTAVSHELVIKGEDEVDNEGLERVETKVLLHSGPIPNAGNATDDDKLHEVTKPKLRLLRQQDLDNVNSIEVVDTVPETPAPPPPPATAPPSLPALRIMPEADLRRTMSDNRLSSRRVTRPLSQLETFKDMLVINAQLYIKDHVPRPPKLLIGRVNEEANESERTPLVTTPSPKGTPLTPKDVVDFYFPRPTKIVNGIQQDDFAGRTVAFFGWIAFITMRMLSLATFCVFYPKAFFIVMGVHYALMLLALALETKCRGGWNRTLFYLVLGYIYIFVLLEFRVCFKSIRRWYVSYLLLTLIENITMSAIWYANEEFESWWFGFIWEWIVYSGILFLATLVVYYCILRPKEVSLIVEDEAPAQEQSVA